MKDYCLRWMALKIPETLFRANPLLLFGFYLLLIIKLETKVLYQSYFPYGYSIQIYEEVVITPTWLLQT